ncbi:hypothetical protein C3492_43925, partial [Streptomyces sp. Ru62]
PLKDKRVATVNRIATAIGRTAAKPAGLDALAPCTLNAGGGGESTGTAPSAPATQQSGAGTAGGGGSAGGNTGA